MAWRSTILAWSSTFPIAWTAKRIIDHGEGLRTAKAAGPSFRYVKLLTLTFGLLQILTLFFFRNFR